MANRLASATSPYLRQHADNPVDWYPWGPEAFAKARAESKPIFLSIGYSTCHWCHVMARESFENAGIAALLNAHFVAIKVDREERPDVDRVYMSYVQALTGHGGWPLSAFLTPELKPFYGGTYFPPEDRQGRPGFATLLTALADNWRTDRAKLEADSERVLAALRQSKPGVERVVPHAPEAGPLAGSIPEGGDRNVLERLTGHDMAPMAGRIADAQKDRLVLRLGAGERLGSPRIPIHGVLGMLPQIR